MVRQVPPEIDSKLNSAVEVFAAQGFDGARVEDLAAATGVSKATLYYYFAGKHEILAHLLGSLLDTMAKAVGEAVTADGTARDRLAGVIRAQLRVIADNPTTCLVLLSEFSRAGRVPEIAERIRAAFHEPVERVLREGLEDRSLRVHDVEAAGAALFGAVTLLGLHYLVAGRAVSVDAAAAQVEAMLMDGMGA